jgi:hypothetical protein
MMKRLEIKELIFNEIYPDLDNISEKLDSLDEKNPVGKINWSKFGYKPEVTFAIGYTQNEILLKYYVTEQYFKAEKTESNQMVCEDSCVEFFVSPDDDGWYYNLEFNGIGTCYMGAGNTRENRIKADPQVISRIRRKTSAGKETTGERERELSWTITIAIPLEVFFRHEIKELKGRTFRANFYKCGDKLSVPHYVTWNPVGTVRPDFHQPAYFGSLRFI